MRRLANLPHSRIWFGPLVLLVLGSQALVAQKKAAAPKVRLSAVIAAFLVDSGVRTRGLPWTTGSELPVKWQTPQPVANPDQFERAKGRTLIRSASFTGTVGDTVALPMTLQLSGVEVGLARVIVSIGSMQVTYQNGHGFFATREMVEQALKNEGLQLQPLKCSRDKEGASNGNLVDAAKFPGKTSSGLWWSWQSAQQELSMSLTILYRRADMSEVECYSG